MYRPLSDELVTFVKPGSVPEQVYLSKVKAGDHGKKELKPTPTKNFKIGFYLKATLSVNDGYYILYLEPHCSVFIQKDGASFFLHSW